MDSAEQRKIDWLTVMLVAGTWLLVAASIWIAMETRSGLGDQVSAMNESTALAWRPYVQLEQEDHQFVMVYLTGIDEKSDTLGLDIEKTSFESPEYYGVTRVRYAVPRSLSIWNSGQSPAWITGKAISVLSEEDWVEKYDKSVQALRDSLRSHEALSMQNVDLIIQPDDTIKFAPDIRTARNMQKHEFKTLVRTKSRIVLYPYSYVEYRDFRGNEYNLLYVEFMITPTTLVDNTPQFGDTSKVGLEQYRWDVGLE